MNKIKSHYKKVLFGLGLAATLWWLGPNWFFWHYNKMIQVGVVLDTYTNKGDVNNE